MPIDIHAAASKTPEQTIALALSGGGSRAIAFHLGCLKALHKAGLLNQVAVISSVSGGSVIAALYCSYPGDFAAFEKKTREVLARGFVTPAIKAALTTSEGLNATLATLVFGADRIAAFIVRTAIKLSVRNFDHRFGWLKESKIRRWASRTTILKRAFSETFDRRRLAELRSDRPKLVIVACELRAKAAFYFTAERLHCWRYGSASSENIEIAQAVAASASYPVFLPALDEIIEFTKNDRVTAHRVTLTDGGVYDNLGLAPFWPNRDPQISLDTGNFDSVIACRAGYGLEISDPAAFMPSRMIAAFDSVYARAQNLAVARLFELQNAGRFKKVLLPYLGQDDRRLALPPENLITAKSVSGYPTDFSAMSELWIDRLSCRGEQLVLSLLAEHWSLPRSR